jgi:hypothetical protein
MTSGRFFTALVLAACALVASVLVAIPTDSPDSLDTDTAAHTATVPPLAGQTGTKPTTRSLQPADESHVALPRLWLGSPIAR